MRDLGEPGLEGGLVHGSRVIGAQLEPGTQARLLVIGCIAGELDAEMPAAGKADNEHRLIDTRELHGPYRAAQHRLKAAGDGLAPVRAREECTLLPRAIMTYPDPSRRS